MDTENTSAVAVDKPRSWKSVLPLLCFMFLVLRISILIGEPPLGSDVPIYAYYMMEQELADREGITLYEYHARQIEAKAQKLRERGKDPSVLAEYANLEYPPLALAFLRLPTLGMSPFGDNVEGKGRGNALRSQEEFTRQYSLHYSLWLASADLGLFVLVILLQGRVLPEASVSQRVLGLSLYIACTTLLWPLLYERLDLVLALLMTASLYLLLLPVHYFWSYAVLAAAINFKLIPVILIPLWVVGSLPLGLAGPILRPRLLVALVMRSVVLLALVVAMFLPFYWESGPATLGFFAYHRERGLEIGSVYSSVLIALGPVAEPLEVRFTYGSQNLLSPWSSLCVALSPVLAAIVLLAASVWLLSFVARWRQADSAVSSSCTLAQDQPLLFVHFTLLYLMLFIATNKVFSPQYLLWLPPFLALLPWENGRQKVLLGAVVALCLLSTVLFPFLFWSDLVGQATLADGTRVSHGPTTRGIMLLLTRNLLFVGVTLSLIVATGRANRSRMA
jgi:hypothetical protein